VVGQCRSTQRHEHVCSPQEACLRQRIRALAVKYPRYGYRRVHVMLINGGYQVNRKWVQRLWRLEGLHVQRPKRRKPKVARVLVVVRGRCPNDVWATDFQFDETTDGRPVKILDVTDEYTREALATNAARRIAAAGTMAVLDQILELRGAPQFLRMDNGPEFIADTLREAVQRKNIKVNYCDMGSPWQNGRIESFNSRLRDELLTREVSDLMWEFRCTLEEHRNNYNHYRPHSALSYLTPIEFATKWRAENSVLASQQVDRQMGSRTEIKHSG
jgi:putative transposase